MTSRRRFLAGVGTAIGSALAGCGYRPGGGDIRWESSVSRGTFGLDGLSVTGGMLYTVVHEDRTFDFESRTWGERGQVAAYAPADDGLTTRWSETTTPLRAHAFGDGSVVAVIDAEVVRFDADGERWRTSISGQPVALALTTDRVYVLTADGDLVALQGAEEWWRRSLPGGSENPELAASADAVIASIDGTLHGLAPDGSDRWTRDRLGGSSVVVDDGLVVLREESTVLRADSGERLWGTADRVDDVAVTDERAYVVADGVLIARDRNGERRWSYGFDGYSANVVADEQGAVVGSDESLAVLDPGGDVRWEVSYRPVEEGPFLVDPGVIAVDGPDVICHVR